MSYFPLSTKEPIDTEEIKKFFNKSFSIKTPGSLLPFTPNDSTKILNSGEYTKSFRWFDYYGIAKNSRIFFKKCTKVFKEDYNSNYYQEPIKRGDFFVSDSKILCVVPLPSFNRHTPSGETNLFFKTSESPFTQIASSRTFNNVFVESDVVIEALTIYKWNTFARSRFLWILLVHAIFYISFSVGVSFAEEVFDYHPGKNMSHIGQFITIIIMFISWLLLVFQEVRQFMYNIPAYMSFYNFIDWIALLMPISSFILLLVNGRYIVSHYTFKVKINGGTHILIKKKKKDEVRSTTTLVLWIHGVLRLRALYTFVSNLIVIDIRENALTSFKLLREQPLSLLSKCH
jgi:hypothetical protein